MVLTSKKNHFISSLLTLGFILSSEISLAKTCQEIYQTRKPAQSIIEYEISPGRVTHLQFSVSETELNKPVFLLLPGVNRSVLMNEKSVTEIKKRGFGVVVMNFSAQPFSVNLLPTGAKPFFKNKKFEIEDFVNEVESVIKYLKSEKKIGNIIPVSLSYTGAISPLISNTGQTIETAPMTSSKAVNPELESWISTLKAGEFFNPIFGPGINRNLLDSAYRKQWAGQVDSITKQFNLNPNHRDNMIEGYTSMSRVVEGMEWKNIQLSKKIKRSFIIAENEGPELLRSQIETSLNLLQLGIPTVVYILKDSGHIIPVDQPEAYAAILAHVAKQDINTSGVVLVDPQNLKLNLISGSAAEKILEDLL